MFLLGDVPEFLRLFRVKPLVGHVARLLGGTDCGLLSLECIG
jgi:hypothetical protein